MPGESSEDKAKEFLYDVTNYLHGLDNPDNTSKPGALRYAYYEKLQARYLPKMLDQHVIVSPQLKISDNKGKADTVKRPVGTEYTDIYLQELDSCFDYWASLNSSERKVDGKTVDWKKEND